MKSSHLVIIVLLLILLVVGWYTYNVITSNKTLDTSAGAKSLSSTNPDQYTNMDGEPVSVDGYLGDVIVVNSWASWSPQSKQQLQILSDLAQQYNGQPVTFLAINRSEPPTTAQAYLRTVEVSDEIEIILDSSDNFYSTIEAYAMPMTIIYDQSGDIVYEVGGDFTPGEVQALIDKQLAL